MNITMIGCPFKTSYGIYADLLRSAIENKTGSKIQWLASNCGCGDPVEKSKIFQIQGCDYFEQPHILNFAYTPERKLWKHWLRTRASHLSYALRSRKYSKLSGDAELVHFQQILNAYGFSAVYHWLNLPSKAARVVTVHELDPYQREFPSKCAVYNKADAIHVHCEELKQELVKRYVQPEKIHVVLEGTAVPAVLEEAPRNGIVFYGGHHLMSGKGIPTLFQAMAILKQRLGVDAPVVTMHGHYSDDSPAQAQPLAEQLGVSDKIEWLSHPGTEELGKLYRSSSVCVLPYSGSFAGFPAALAAANGLPVIATRKAGIPDHLGDCGIWIDENNAEQLAQRVMGLLASEALWQEQSARLRQRAKDFLSIDVIAERTLEVYEQALKNKAKPSRQ